VSAGGEAQILYSAVHLFLHHEQTEARSSNFR
jgi:hypothetical protein